jgi:hypothetical protein
MAQSQPPPPPPESKFFVDPTSAEQAEELMQQLRSVHMKLLEEPRELLRAYERTNMRGYRLFAEPMQKGPSDVPLRNLEADVDDFGEQCAVAKYLDKPLSGLRIDGERAPVPILLSSSLFGPRRLMFLYQYMMEGLRDFAEEENGMEIMPLEKAQESFFDGLRSFLAARIAGVRWMQRRHGQGDRGEDGGGSSGFAKSGSGGGTGFFSSSGGGGTSGRGGGGGSSTGQFWEVHTTTKHLSLYYGCTHAIRLPATHLGGLTTPDPSASPLLCSLPVFLPMGTVYLAADAGPGGSLKWDTKGKITVPDLKPVYPAKDF